MRLENLVKKILAPAIVSSAIFLASCGGSSGGGKNVGGSGGAGGALPPPPITTPSHVVSEGDVSEYSPTSGTIYFSSPTNLNGGDIIASGITSAAPNGFLRKVSYISPDKKTVYTQNQNLEDTARETGNGIGIVINPRYLTPSNLTSLKFAKGISPQSLGFYDFEAAGTLDFLGGNVTATGLISFDSGFSLVVGAEDNLENISFTANFDQFSSLEVTALNSLSNFQQNIKIAEYNFTPFIAGYIPTPVPIPIIIKPQVEVNLDFSGNISPVSTSITQESSLTSKIEYFYGQWSANKFFDKLFTFTPPTLPETSNFKAKIIPRLNLLFYGVAGPYGEMSGNLDFNSNSQGWSLYGGLEGKIGIDMTVISDKADFSAMVLDFNELLASSGNGGGGGGNSSSTITDSRDGKTYKTVQIGTQLWIAENLNFATTGLCYGDSSSCNVYGRLYSWNDAKNACPTGWRLPDYGDINTLLTAIGATNSGGKLKETGTSHWAYPNSDATNESGFTALPGGLRYSNGSYDLIGSDAFFWISSQSSSLYGYYLKLMANFSLASTSSDDKNKLMSVRCLQN
ncbi:MAG: fibrobacter succinogenes major paralogous domain-containing protein [Nanoarchaeota archaeon]